MCNGFGGGCSWIIIIILILLCCGNGFGGYSSNCGCNNSNDCGCNCGCNGCGRGSLRRFFLRGFLLVLVLSVVHNRPVNLDQERQDDQHHERDDHTCKQYNHRNLNGITEVHSNISISTNRKASPQTVQRRFSICYKNINNSLFIITDPQTNFNHNLSFFSVFFHPAISDYLLNGYLHICFRPFSFINLSTNTHLDKHGIFSPFSAKISRDLLA